MELPPPGPCEPSCTAANRIDELNQSCYCIGVDVVALRQRLEAEIGQRGLGADLLRTHPHLFASQPLFVSRTHVEQMAAVMQAVESVVALPGYVQAALAWAPELARVDHGMRGGLLGYDFHLGDGGPQLIEINTNPGGALLNVMLAEAQRYCCGMATDMSLASPGVPDVNQEIFATFMAEWQSQRGSQPLRTVAIVDEDPERQFLYPEFVLYRQLFERNGLDAIICDPQELEHVAARCSIAAGASTSSTTGSPISRCRRRRCRPCAPPMWRGTWCSARTRARMRCMRTSATSRCWGTRRRCDRSVAPKA